VGPGLTPRLSQVIKAEKTDQVAPGLAGGCVSGPPLRVPFELEAVPTEDPPRWEGHEPGEQFAYSARNGRG